MRTLTLSLATLFLASSGLAQDEAEFPTWMKSLGPAMGSMRKNLEAKQGAEAATDAEKVAGIFKQVEAFYAKSNTEDAVKWATTAQTAATEVAAAATAGDFERAGAGVKQISGTCGPCHTAHREKIEGGYKLK
ncbi:MAG: hypothetical protein M3Z09_02920 [Acidobacteriota bacterium]|nr:hypothetical protein [Acidobacteriota bacterium]